MAKPQTTMPSDQSRASQPKSRMRRVLFYTASTLGLCAIFASAATTGLILHLNTKPVRGLATDITNSVLGSVFQGKIVADDIQALSLNGIKISGATAVDPSGQQVIRVSHLEAHTDVPKLLQSVLLGSGDIVIDIPYIRIEQANVLVEHSPTGGVTLGDTFTPRPPKKKPSKPSTPTTPPREVRLALSHIEIGRAWAHGMVAPPLALDAEVGKLVGALFVTPDGLSLTVEETDLVDRSFLSETTKGIANYELQVGQKVWMRSSFAGLVGAVGVTAGMTMDDGYLEAAATLPRATPEELQAFVPLYPVKEPIFARLKIAGIAPQFDLTGSVEIMAAGPATGSIELAGGIDASDRTRIDVDAYLRSFDPRIFGSDLPATQIAADARITTEIGPTIRLVTDVRTEPFAIGDQSIPAIDAHVVLDRGQLFGKAHLHETGMPIDAQFVGLPEWKGVRFAATSDIPSLSAAPRIAGPIGGSASVRVEGTLEGTSIDANVQGQLANLRVGQDLALSRGRVQGRLSGSLADPLNTIGIDASLTGSDIHAGSYAWDSVHAKASGNVASPRIRLSLDDSSGSVKAAGRLTTKTGTLHGVDLRIQRDDNVVEGKIATIGATPRGVLIEGIQLAGDKMGSLDGKLVVRGDDITGRLTGQDVDLDRMTQMLGLPYRVKGIANIDIALERGRNGRNGKVAVELEGGSVSLLSGISANLTATFENDKVNVDALARLVSSTADQCSGTIASIRLSHGQGTLSGPLLRPQTWTNLVGSADVAAEDWNLHCLAQMLPIYHIVSDVQGKLSTRFQVTREAHQQLPSIQNLVSRTYNLQLAGPQSLSADEPAWQSRWIDAQLKGSFDGETGKAESLLTLFDGDILGDLTTSIQLDLPALLDQKVSLASSIQKSPIVIKFAMPRRSIRSLRKTLPTFVVDQLPPIRGELRLDAYAEGTLDNPFFGLHAQGFRIAYRPQQRGSNRFAFPIDLDAVATYDGKQAALNARLARNHQDFSTLHAEVRVNLDDLTGPRPKSDSPLWTGNFHAKLDNLPLGELPVLADYGMTGNLSGTIEMNGLNEAPTLDADLELPQIKLGHEVLFDQSRLSLHIHPRTDGAGDMAVAKATLTCHDSRQVDASAYATIRWDDKLLPTIDKDRAADLFASVKSFPLSAIQPFLGDAVSKLDGSLSGDVRIGWGRVGNQDAGSIHADMRIKNGVIHVPQLGQELYDASITIIANEGNVQFNDISARGMSGRVTGRAVARLDGLKLLNAGGYLLIREGQELPITLEGVPLGTARGELMFAADMKQDELALNITVPNLHLALPPTSNRDVQSLDDNPDITLSHRLGPPKEQSTSNGLRYSINLNLGQIELEGSGFEVKLTSKTNSPPRFVVTDKARASGDILIQSGKLEVMGKEFEIEHGLVHLREEDTSNPYLNVTAFWDAPDGSRIYIDYIGVLKPITSEKLKFRSNPPSSQKDILARLLFGTENAQIGADSEGPDTSVGQAAGNVAGGVGGDIAASQFNALLEGIAPLRGFSTRLATTDEGALRTTVIYELGDTVTAEASYEGAGNTSSTAGTTSTTPGGAASQRSDRKEVSIDWRFYKNWSLRGTVGVGGAQSGSGILDLLWQYRY